MIGHEHIDAERRGLRDAGDTADAVIDRDQQSGGPLPRRRHLHDLRSEAIPELEAVGHQEVGAVKTHGAKPEQEQRRAGGPVSVVITDHQNRLVAIKRIGQAPSGGLEPQEAGWGKK